MQLKQNQRPGTVTEQLAMLLACGVPARPACLQSFILRGANRGCSSGAMGDLLHYPTESPFGRCGGLCA